MSLHLIIKKAVLCLFIAFAVGLNAQNNEGLKEAIESDVSIPDSKQRNVAYSIGYHNPIPTGDNFIGNGLEGNGGLNFKVQIYVYKQFFVGGSLGASYFDVKDPSILGDYKKTRIAEQFLFLGYEFIPTENFRIGLTASVFGKARYKNQKSDNVYQIDTARLNSYGIYLTYEISREFMIYLDYAFRIDKTRINVPTALEGTFRKGAFSQIGIGLKFSFIGKDFISLF
jgi:hypothetical protein